jgi:hypothetical protein
MLNVEWNVECDIHFSSQHSAFSISYHHPQQSVLNRHAGQRQTACMRNMSAPHRSQRTFSSPVDAQDGWAVGRLDRIGWARWFWGRKGFVGSGTR